MLGFKLTHVSKRGPRGLYCWGNLKAVLPLAYDNIKLELESLTYGGVQAILTSCVGENTHLAGPYSMCVILKAHP